MSFNVRNSIINKEMELLQGKVRRVEFCRKYCLTFNCETVTGLKM